MSKELVYVDLMHSISFIVPKKRGDGWLKTPIWVKATSQTEQIMDIPGVICVCGLDGCVDVEFHRVPTKPINRDEVRSQIEKIYGLPMRYDPDLFWSVVNPTAVKRH